MTSIACIEELQTIKRKILENGLKWASEDQNSKFWKTKTKMSQGVLCQKIMFLCQKLIASCRGPMSHGLFLSWILEHTGGRSRSRPKQKQTLAQSAIKDHFQRFQQYLYFFPMYAYCKDRTYKMYFLALKRLFEFCSDLDLILHHRLLGFTAPLSVYSP